MTLESSFTTSCIIHIFMQSFDNDTRNYIRKAYKFFVSEDVNIEIYMEYTYMVVYYTFFLYLCSF